MEMKLSVTSTFDNGQYQFSCVCIPGDHPETRLSVNDCRALGLNMPDGWKHVGTTKDLSEDVTTVLLFRIPSGSQKNQRRRDALLELVKPRK